MLICFGLCGSFCTVGRAVAQMKKLVDDGNEMLAVGSFAFCSTDTRFGSCAQIKNEIRGICGRPVIETLDAAEPIGPVIKPDLMILAPCTGNSLAKLRHGIYDTPALLAAKSHLRNCRPLLIALATNDALSGNFENLAALYNRKNVFFVPLLQDDPAKKPCSLVCDFERIPEAADAALNGRQLLPLFVK